MSTSGVKIDHVSINVRDLDRAVEFYQDVLNMTLAYRGEWRDSDIEAGNLVGIPGSSAKMAMMTAQAGRLELIQYRQPDFDDGKGSALSLGLNHFCIQVDDFSMYERRLASYGIEFVSAPAAFNDMKYVYFHDPFGNRIELKGY